VRSFDLRGLEVATSTSGLSLCAVELLELPLNLDVSHEETCTTLLPSSSSCSSERHSGGGIHNRYCCSEPGVCIMRRLSFQQARSRVA